MSKTPDMLAGHRSFLTLPQKHDHKKFIALHGTPPCLIEVKH
ncbi:MAG: hypothetical protein ABJR46_06395 [Tateyamaria sp.]